VPVPVPLFDGVGVDVGVAEGTAIDVNLKAMPDIVTELSLSK
jgi:hypothetical protein